MMWYRAVLDRIAKHPVYVAASGLFLIVLPAIVEQY